MGIQNETGPGRAAPKFIMRVGARVRAMRQERQWTVQQLADVAEVSRRMLTQIELGQANPSLVTIDRIARALDTHFANLARPEPIAAVSPPNADPTPVWSDGSGSEAVLLGATSTNEQASPAPAGTNTELWRWTLASGERYDAQPDQAGAQEIHHVLSGKLTIETTSGFIALSAGESAVIRSDRQYSYINEGPADAVFHRVVTGA